MSSRSSRRGHRRVLVPALAVAMTLTACSSTNDKKADGVPEGDSLGTSATPSPSPSVLTGTNGQPLTKSQIVAAVKAGKLPKTALKYASTAPTSAAGAGKSSGRSSAPGTTAATGMFPGQSGPGFTAQEIKVGLSLFKVGSVGEQFGINASYGDGQKQAQAVVDYVNAHGGVAGRKVVPVYYTVDFGRAGSVQDGQFEAEACEKWAHDDRVFFALNNAMARQALLTCLGKAGVPAEHDGMNIDEQRLAPYRNFYYSGTGAPTLTIDRSATTRVKVLGARGWFKDESSAKPTVVGIEYYNEKFYDDVVRNKMVPLIKSFGVEKVVLQAAPRGATTPDSTYVSRFQAEGVTHVFFLGEANAYPMTFMAAAENQQYRPKYGLTSDQSPAFLESTSPIPRAQLANSTGVGWSPLVDVNAAADPGPSGPNEKLCLDIQAKAGQNMADRGARLTASTYCNALFFLKQNLERAPALTAAGLAQAVAGLGRRFDNVGIFTPSSYTSSKHDGADTYRDFAFVNGRFVYTSKSKAMPQ
jgi:hypothetical protein